MKKLRVRHRYLARLRLSYDPRALLCLADSYLPEGLFMKDVAIIFDSSSLVVVELSIATPTE